MLTLRLTDGCSWSHEFTAGSTPDLRDGCLEAWVQCVAEWQRRAAELPAHQTRKRALMLASTPRELQLHVLDDASSGRAWVHASYGTRDGKALVIRRPGTAPDGETWPGADWPGAWARCKRCAAKMMLLSAFCGSVARD